MCLVASLRRSFNTAFKRAAPNPVLRKGVELVCKVIDVNRLRLRSQVDAIVTRSRGSAGSRIIKDILQAEGEIIGHKVRSLMTYCNWERPHRYSGSLAPPIAEEKLNLLSGIT